MALARRLKFLRSYLRDPGVVGSVAPSSLALAAALCEPFRQSGDPACVLEIGAGTGAVTRHLGRILGDRDTLDICEVKHDFAEALRKDVLSNRDFVPAVASGRVQLLPVPVQEIDYQDRYDFVISGLPFTAFKLQEVLDIFRVVRRLLKPGGVFSYFEYVGIRRTSRLLSMGRRRERIRGVSSYLSRTIRSHQFHRRMVLRNFPPAHARHLRFDDNGA